LGLLGVSYDVTKADIDETPLPGEAAADYTLRLSREKAQAVLKNVDSDCLILAADTTVADGTAILGKPADPMEARAMLIQLRGRVHQVYTAITLLDVASGRIHSEVALTDVYMRSYTDAEMEAYIASGDPFDKAGGYAIQNPEFHPVEELRGCYSNVVGLPLCYLAQALRDFGITLNLKIEFECQFHPGSDCVLNAAMI
jgi:MAF protein